MYTYYVAGLPYSDTLAHHGIKGQKWGIRRYQYPDGTLTPEGKLRYNKHVEKIKASGLGPLDYSKQKIDKKVFDYANQLYSKRLTQLEELHLRNKLPSILRHKIEKSDKIWDEWLDIKKKTFASSSDKKKEALLFKQGSKIDGEIVDSIMNETMNKVISRYGEKYADDVYDFLRQFYGLQIYF